MRNSVTIDGVIIKDEFINMQSIGCGHINLEFLFVELPDGRKIMDIKSINRLSYIEEKNSHFIFKCLNCGRMYKLKRGEALSKSNCIYREWRIA